MTLYVYKLTMRIHLYSALLLHWTHVLYQCFSDIIFFFLFFFSMYLLESQILGKREGEEGRKRGREVKREMERTVIMKSTTY